MFPEAGWSCCSGQQQAVGGLALLFWGFGCSNHLQFSKEASCGQPSKNIPLTPASCISLSHKSKEAWVDRKNLL